MSNSNASTNIVNSLNSQGKTSFRDVLIFFSYKKHKTGYYNQLFNPLRAVAADYKLRLHQGSLKDLHIEIIENQLHITEALTGRSLDSFDFVRFELWLKSPQQALAAAQYMSRHDIPFSGHEAANTACSTKIGELVRMSDQGIPLPRTFTSSHEEILKSFQSETPPIAYPVIAKAADTFGGKMNYLVNNYDELETALNQHKDQFFLIQEFIPNDCDYRVLIMGGEIKLIMKRTRDNKTGSHLNNTSAGASGEFIAIDSLSDEVRNCALKAAEMTLRADFAGVDVLFDKYTGRYYVLEVNEAPAIQTGEHPEQKIAVLMEYMSECAHRKGNNG